MTTGNMPHDQLSGRPSPLTSTAPANPVSVSGQDSGPPREPGQTGTGRDRSADPPVPEPEFDQLEDWVTEYFLPMFRRTLGGDYRWCGQWWRHGEAISRLGALWHAWEVLRIQPGTGIATWYREHLDHQLLILLGARGPFYQCSEQAHREPHQPTADPAPTGWWDHTAALAIGADEHTDRAAAVLTVERRGHDGA
jgi:hypothetical protein